MFPENRILLQIEGAYIAEIKKRMEYEESRQAPLILAVRTGQHHTNSSLLQTVKNFENYFQSET
jgi:hypothetical protein